jgi:Fe2+ or Zn2+ uptake regulation protein
MTLESLHERIRESSLRLTKGKLAVLECLYHGHSALTAQEIFESITSATEIESTDLVTVYRTLEALVKIGVIEQVEHSTKGKKFQIVGRSHTHTVHCVVCGTDVEMQTCLLESVEKKIAAQTGFRALRHTVNFYGECPQCVSGS